MKDTDPEIENLQREMVQRLTPSERARMGSSMYDTARELMESGFRARNPHGSQDEIRYLVFKAFYGKDFEASRWKKIEARFFSPDHSVLID
ncbi:MAG: hypothetical protein JNK54_00035 [Elusimicrobia bacterium]|jgi:hypothetical protein|nr:hypothetical protein [Elusimicrobiota bacterium]